MKSKSLWQRLRPKRRGLVILDDYFPNLATGFRVAEYNALMGLCPGLRVLSAYPEFEPCYAEYQARYPQYSERIARFDGTLPDFCGFVYVNFLNNAIQFLPAIEARQVPFLVTLYPGGGFGLDEETSDSKLRRVLDSPLLRGVITTQPVTQSYIEARLPARLRSTLIRGVVVNPLYFATQSLAPRAYFGHGKDTFDVCFVAEKYMPLGANKGYPEFIAAANALYSASPRLRWHVIGNFSASDCDVAALGTRIRFWGRLATAELRDALRGMDAIVSPNQPFKLHAGNFDGFPTGCCVEASLCGVAMIVTDPLGQNPGYVDESDILLIPPDPKAIVARISDLLSHPCRIGAIGQRGQRLSQRLYAPELQVGQRHTLLKTLAAREGCRI